MWLWVNKFASPPHAYRLATKLRPWLFWPALVTILWSTYQGLFVVPADYQQGDAFRIIYVHVPSASMSLIVYSAMAIAAAVGIIWRIKLAHAAAASCAAITVCAAPICRDGCGPSVGDGRGSSSATSAAARARRWWT